MCERAIDPRHANCLNHPCLDCQRGNKASGIIGRICRRLVLAEKTKRPEWQKVLLGRIPTLRAIVSGASPITRRSQVPNRRRYCW